MQTHALSRIIVAVITVIALAAAPAVMAITTTWTGSGDGTTWIDTGNWDNGVPVPGASDTVIVQGTMGSPITLDMTGSAANNIEDLLVTIEWADVQNGVLNGAEGTGTLLMENSTLTTGGAAIAGTMPSSVTLNHVTYFDTANPWDIDAGQTVTIQDPPGGQNEFRTAYWRLRSTGGDVNMTVDGATNDPNWGVYDVGFLVLNDSSGGNTATLTLSNGSGVRINSGATIGTAATGAAVLDLQSGMLRLDQYARFGTTAVLQTGNATLNLVSESGHYRNEMSEANFDGEGLIIQFGHVTAAARTFEMAGTDDGSTFQGFHDNFSIDELVIGNYAASSMTMDLQDGYDNDGAGQGTPEVLYTDRLDIDHAMTIDFNSDKKIYYKKLEGDLGTLTLSDTGGGGGFIQVTGADLFKDPGFVHEPTRETLDADTVSTLDLTDADYGTVLVTDFVYSDPGKYFVLLDLGGAGIGDIGSLATELGAEQVDADTLRMQFTTLTPDGTDLFFDWNFSHLNILLTDLTLETVPEPSTVLLLGIGGLAIYGWRRRRG